MELQARMLEARAEAPLKRIFRDSSSITFMSLGDKLSFLARCFSHCFGSHGRTLPFYYFCNRLRLCNFETQWKLPIMLNPLKVRKPFPFLLHYLQEFIWVDKPFENHSFDRFVRSVSQAKQTCEIASDYDDPHILFTEL